MHWVHALLGRLSRRFGWKKIVFLAGLLLSGVAIAAMVPPGAFNQGRPNGTPLQILWTNDTHGFFLPVYHAEYSEIDTYEQTAATEGKVGGYAQIAGLVKKLKEGIWRQNTLFVDAGDTFDGSPVAQMTRGQAVVPVLNAMGYDAWTPGNRDFAWPKADVLAVTSQLDFPIVCANLQDADTGEYVFPRYLIKQIGGLKVALIGLTSTAGGGQGFKLLGGSIPGSFAIEDDISALAADIRAKEDPDLVVVLSHMGFYQDQKFASRSTGIDVIVGAHTHHNVYQAPVVTNADGSRDVIVVQAGSHGKFLGRLQLWVKDHKVDRYSQELVRVSEANLRSLHVKPDAVVEKEAELAYAPFKAYLDEVIGYTTTVVERRGDTQSTMTNFLTDALAERFGTVGALFPGIRYGSSIIPGPITVGDVWNIVSPNFGNDGIYAFTLKIRQIRGILNNFLNSEYGPDPYYWNGGDVMRFNNRVAYEFYADPTVTLHLADLSVTDSSGQLVTNPATDLTFVATFPPPFAQNATQMYKTDGSGNQVPISAVDEIVDYIKSKGTIAPELDDRTIQLDKDTVPTNVADIGVPSPTTGHPSPPF